MSATLAKSKQQNNIFPTRNWTQKLQIRELNSQPRPKEAVN